MANKIEYPHLLMSRKKNFCSVQFRDWNPNDEEWNSRSYVEVNALEKELRRLQKLAKYKSEKPNKLAITAIFNIMRSNDLPNKKENQ